MKKHHGVVLLAGLLLVPAFGWTDSPPQPVGKGITWTTPDGIRLVGLYEPAKPGHRTWILLHGLGSNKQEWLPFVRALIGQGEGFLIYDARGHGNSTRGPNGTISYQDFKTVGAGSPWDRMAADVETAVKALQVQQKVTAQQIAIGGASLGANVALVYASQHPEVPALILLSPGLEYAGVVVEEPFRRYGTRPVFIAASPGDAYAYASVRQLILKRSDPACQLASGPGAAHGVNMFDAAFTAKLLDWIKNLK